jgi:hypothetical protein
MEALDGSVEAMERGLMPQLAEGFRHFVFDFLLVERAREWTLLCGRGVLVRLLPTVVEHDYLQAGHVSQIITGGYCMIAVPAADTRPLQIRYVHAAARAGPGVTCGVAAPLRAVNDCGTALH